MTLRVHIEKFSHDGRGIARVDGKTMFVDGALPHETVVVQVVKQKKNYDEARVVEVIQAAADRVAPLCQHYGVCGGCSLQHLRSSAQIEVKQTQFLDVLNRLGAVAPKRLLAPLTADFWHYRHKARLSVNEATKDSSRFLGFRAKDSAARVVPIQDCPVLTRHASALIGKINAILPSLSTKSRLDWVDVAVGDDEVAVVIRYPSGCSQHDRGVWTQFAQEQRVRVVIHDSNAAMDADVEMADCLTYALPEHQVMIGFYPTDFTQVNRAMNRLMVNQALELLALKPTDRALDLFCGVGNFSIPMARRCAHVTGIEVSHAMVERACMNARANDVAHVDFYCLDLDKLDSTHVMGPVDKMLLDPHGCCVCGKTDKALAPTTPVVCVVRPGNACS